MGTVTTFNLAVVINEQRKGRAFSGMSKDMGQASSAAGHLGNQTEVASTRMQRFKDRLRTVGAMLKNMIVPGLTIAAMAFLKFSKETFMDFAKFDQGIRETFTLLPGISADMREKLTRDAKSIAREFGRLPDEVLPAMYQALSAGIPQGSVVESVELAAKAATAGVAELEETMVTGQAVVNAYGGELYSLEEVYDIIFMLIKNGVVTMDDLNKTLQNVTSVAAESDTPFEDIAAALVVMTRQGDSATEATELLQLLLMQLATDGTSAFRAFQEASGIAYRDFIAQGGNLIEALILMENHADDTGQSLSSMIAGDSRFFRDSQAGRASMELTGKHLQDLIDQSENFKDVTGSMGAAFKEVSGGVQYDVDKMSASWDVFKITFGEWVAETGILGITGTKVVEGAIAVFDQWGGGLRDDTERMIELRSEENDGLVAQLDLYNDLLAISWQLNYINAQDLIDSQGLKVFELVARGSTSLKNFEDNLIALGLAQELAFDPSRTERGEVYIDMLERRAGAVWEETQALIATEIELAGMGKAATEAADADKILTRETTAAAIATLELRNMVGTVVPPLEDATEATIDFVDANREMEKLRFAPDTWLNFLSPEVLDYFDTITESSGTLFDTYGELAEAEGTWIDVFLDNSEKIKEASDEIAGDLTKEQKEAMWDIVDNVTEGGVEWLAAWDAIQGDITKTQRNELIAQRADLEESHGTWVSAFTGDAKAAEEAKELIAETLDEIAEAYDNLALAIFERELFENLPGDTYEAQIAMLNLKKEMGLIDPNQVTFLTSQLETASLLDDVLTTMYSDFTANKSPLTEEEIAQIGVAVNLVETGVNLTEEGVIRIATAIPASMTLVGKAIQADGINKFEDMEDRASLLIEEPYIPEIDVDDEEAIDQLSALDKHINKVTRDRTVHVSISYSDPGAPVLTGSHGVGHSSGGVFDIPPGYPGDSHGPHYFQSGERVIVQTPAQQAAQSGGATFEGDTNVFYVSDRSTARLVTHLISEKKRERYNRMMGR